MFVKLYQKIKKDVHIASYGQGPGDRLALFFYSVLWSFLVRLHFSKEIPLSISISAFGKRHQVRFCDASDLTAFREVFVDRVYDISSSIEPKTIVDLGSNAGFSVLYFKTKYPQSYIHAFEPEPHVYQRLLRNTRQFGATVSCHEEAITNTVGTVQLYGGDLLGSSTKNRGWGVAPITVVSTTLDTVWERFNFQEVDLLKFDIEGAEEEVFKTFKKKDFVYMFVGELHTDWTNTTPAEFAKYFPNFVCSFTPLMEGRYSMAAVRKLS